MGRAVEKELLRQGFKVTAFDRLDGLDIRRRDQLQIAMTGCDAVIHLAAIAGNDRRRARELLEVNILGTWNVLTVAAAAGVRRVVYMSSVNALGVFSGEGSPNYLPIDDDHPPRPRSAYGVSKLAGEEMCRVFTETDGLTTVCLRPPAVWDEPDYRNAFLREKAASRHGRRLRWEYGAFLDIRDLSTAVVCALDQPPSGHVRLLLCAGDICSGGQTSRELTEASLPGVEWRGAGEYDDDPARALIDVSRARKVLDWVPEYTWKGFVSEQGTCDRSPPARFTARAWQILLRLRGLA